MGVVPTYARESTVRQGPGRAGLGPGSGPTQGGVAWRSMPPGQDSAAPLPPRPVLAAVLGVAVIAISFAAILVRLADGPPLVVALYRMLIASVVVLPITIRALRRTPIRGKAAWLTVAAGA